MKKVSYEEFLTLNEDIDVARLKEIGARQEYWTALDVLQLDGVSAEEKLQIVLREEFIDAPILHEFACRCAEQALAGIETPDPRSIAAIQAKRDWLKGSIDDIQLKAARDAAWSAARDAAWSAASAAASEAAWDAASAAAWDASWSAASAAASAAARAAARAAAWNEQCSMLIDLLLDSETNNWRIIWTRNKEQLLLCMSDGEVEKIMQDAISHYGADSQINMCIEECAELIQALQKYKRYKDNPKLIESIVEHVLEELADVKIMTMQMNILFEQTNKLEMFKLNRLKDRIKMERESETDFGCNR